MKLFNTLIFCLILCVCAAPLFAATYSEGDACAVAGALHQTNDTDGYYTLVCDGSNWLQALTFSSSGYMARGKSLTPPSWARNYFSTENDGAAESFKNTIYSYAFSNGSSATYNSTVAIGAGALSAATGAGQTEAIAVYGDAAGTNDAKGQQPRAFRADVRTHDTDSGTGLYITDDNASTGGTIMGIYINLDDTDVYRYGIWQQSANENYFAGSVGIGDTSPDVALDVIGDINYTGVLTDV